MGKMNVLKKIYGAAILASALWIGCAQNAQAQTEKTIAKGVYVESVDLSGMTAQQATDAVEAYVELLMDRSVTLVTVGGHEEVVTPRDLGMIWTNTEIVQEALGLVSGKNLIERYKAIKDLEREPKVYDLELGFDYQAVSDILTTRCTQYDVEAEDYSLSRENGEFLIHVGATGYALDVEDSIDDVVDYLVQDWDHQNCRIELDITQTVPRGGNGELEAVTDVLGTFTTSYKSSGSSRSTNVANGCKLINGQTLYPGEELNTLDLITPFTEANGYLLAGSYLNGQVVESFGGGICQVSTTLYNAVLLAELEVTERYNHSMIVTYVDPSADAAIAESSGKNFCFVNNTDYPIYVEGYTTSDKHITFTIYGKETRDTANRSVRYESEVLETTYPESDVINADGGQPFGYIVTSGMHVGYKAKLWKIVTENGKETRTEVNKSTYKMSPRTATVGVATDNADAYNAIMAAIGSGSIDNVKAVIAAYTAPAEPAAE
jgi:vancomycin resistance protein YoaR